ncbi:MAG: hypothetical protein NC350_04225 [Corallococcus sp.]|nr:hypothetical protein [Corallococcus sp.]
MQTKDLLAKVLIKKAKGYTVREKTDEYAASDGNLNLVKRKIVTKHVPPDISAVKALLTLTEMTDNLETLTDEQLQQEKTRLLNMLSQINNDNGITTEEQNA